MAFSPLTEDPLPRLLFHFLEDGSDDGSIVHPMGREPGKEKASSPSGRLGMNTRWHTLTRLHVDSQTREQPALHYIVGNVEAQ